MAKVYEFTVTGRGSFPYDMLRYDACWPANTESANMMDEVHATPGERRAVKTLRLRSHNVPTPERWASFMWKVAEVRKY